MAYDKKTFLKEVVILHDTGEQKNGHILRAFDEMGIKHQAKNLDYGDYSFAAQGRDFSFLCVIERKANVNELYGNLTQDRGRIEREFALANNSSKEFILLIENCGSMDELKDYKVPDWEMEKFNRKRQSIGLECYSTILSWECGNRYNFRTVFVADNTQTATKILERFYWFWRNFKIQTANRRGMRK